MERLLGGLPEARPAPAVHVVGSNGKGSVATMAACLLQTLGLKVGLFTSPHLRSFRERFRIDGEPVSEELLGQAMALLEPRLDRSSDDPTLAFEAMTALAAMVFYQAAVDVVVWEAGIGGRHDATRFFAGKTAALVSVDLEHTKVLGDTLQAVALDKAEIVGAGGTLVLGDLPRAVTEAVQDAARRRRVRIEAIEPAGFKRELLDRARFPAPYAEHNAALALATVRAFTASETSIPVSADWQGVARRAFAELTLPGRMERILVDGDEGPEIWCDIAHTPDALARVAEACETVAPGACWTVLLGLSADKVERADVLVEPLLGVAASFICTRAWHRGGDPALLEGALRARGRQAFCLQDPKQALERALVEARSRGHRVLITGSLFLAVEMAELLAGRDPQALRFYG